MAIPVKQNVRVQGKMHPETFLSRGRGGGLWWPAAWSLVVICSVIRPTGYCN